MLESDKGGKVEELAMEEAVRAQWSRESDRDAVLKKLRECGLRSYLGLVKCIVSPTWHARIPRSCRLRGIPTLINVLISDKIKGAKLLRSQSLRSLVAMGTLALNTKPFLILSTVRSLGLTCEGDMRALLLMPAELLESEEKELQKVLRESLLALVPYEVGNEETKLSYFMSHFWEVEPGLQLVLSSACDSEGEGKHLKDSLQRCGVHGLVDLMLTLFTSVDEVHDARHCLLGESTLLNQLLLLRCGKQSMLTSSCLLRLARLTALESADGSSGLIFTAPHGIFLHRPGHADHKAEVYTSTLAQTLAQDVDASFVIWSEQERSRSGFLQKPEPFNHDPNYVPDDIIAEVPFYRFCLRHIRRFRNRRHGVLLVDVHGRRDVIARADGSCDQSDCDIGVGALEYSSGKEQDRLKAAALRESLSRSLSELLGASGFTVNSHPKLSGFISSINRRVDEDEPRYNTMSMQAVRMGLPAVQLELSLRLRKALRNDEDLRCQFAHALLESSKSVAFEYQPIQTDRK
ncbi:hypothetical protein GUITHDRAFT_164279 [Guillardia theta CCMP2712]|uniref:Uncharacterized protein n=1 Tax=Guillardia theta (strain CCMP2712) TaxID=905079 RepID=L1J1F6_GUITC|nr:hypothetical protein GUITHDRAFT_164279 [Guillardia theta CCMP2712]EKX41974.1 hypothetical protein GUITHDRAFT_164279 [Guillardia theta CCMP2712]|eukprot:XP_005828954.1 hypothetical protein GUITHDRAFT_164279 [Guillardia theta CCMP2712]